MSVPPSQYSSILCFFLFFFSSRRRHTRYWRDWSSDVCSSDLKSASGYDTTVSNWNAADAIPWFLADFGANVVYKFPREGMQSIPDGIRRLFEGLRGSVLLHHTVKRVAKNGATIRLEFEGKPDVEADEVVLAMPRRALELIDLSDLFGKDAPRVTSLIESVSPQPLFKLFACYGRPWWTDQLQIIQGQTTTDIPIRQTYYFGTEIGRASCRER